MSSSRGTYRSQRSGGRRAVQPIASTRIAAERAPLDAQRFVGDRKHSGSGTVPTPARRWRSWRQHPSGWAPFRHRPLTAESILPLVRHPIRRDSVLHPCCTRAPSRPVFASPAHGTTAPARSSDNRPLRVVSAARGFPIPFARTRRTPWGGRDRLPVGRGVSTFQPRRTLLGANHPPYSGRTPAAATGLAGGRSERRNGQVRPRRRFLRASWPDLLRPTGGLPVDIPPPGRHCGAMIGSSPSVLDEIYGAQALGALLAGDLESALDALGRASTRYVAGFLCRLGLLMPSVSARLACGLARRRLSRLRRG